MSRKDLTDNQIKVLKVMEASNIAFMTCSEIANVLGVSVYAIASSLAGLKKRGLIGSSLQPKAPLEIFANNFVIPGQEFIGVIRKTHWFLAKNSPYLKAFSKVRRGCAGLYIRRYYKLTFNQQQQALQGNWNV